MPITDCKVQPAGPGDAVVRAWSIGGRLPYKTATEGLKATEMRRQLGRSLAQLSAGEDELLHATLISPWVKGTDTENVLFYNVAASGSFARTCRRGLRFEHLPAVPVEPGLSGAEHEQRYQVASMSDGFRHWRIAEPLIGFDWIEVPNYDDADPKTSEVWWPIQTQATPRQVQSSAYLDRYALKLELETTVANASTRVKRAVDAVVTSHQFEPTSTEPSVLGVLERQLTVPAIEIENQLTSRERAVLGPKPVLIEPWGQTLRFNPDDDRLMAFELLLRPLTGGRWRMRGSLFAVEPATDD